MPLHLRLVCSTMGFDVFHRSDGSGSGDQGYGPQAVQGDGPFISACLAGLSNADLRNLETELKQNGLDSFVDTASTLLARTASLDNDGFVETLQTVYETHVR